MSVVLLKLIDYAGFRMFMEGRLSDSDLLDRVFGRDWLGPVRDTDSANVVEAAVIGAHETAVQGRRVSPLLARCQADVQTEESQGKNSRILYWHEASITGAMIEVVGQI